MNPDPNSDPAAALDERFEQLRSRVEGANHCYIRLMGWNEMLRSALAEVLVEQIRLVADMRRFGHGDRKRERPEGNGDVGTAA